MKLLMLISYCYAQCWQLQKQQVIHATTQVTAMKTAIDSKLNTVHSRNSVMFGEMVPSQYYGKYTIK